VVFGKKEKGFAGRGERGVLLEGGGGEDGQRKMEEGIHGVRRERGSGGMRVKPQLLNRIERVFILSGKTEHERRCFWWWGGGVPRGGMVLGDIEALFDSGFGPVREGGIPSKGLSWYGRSGLSSLI